MSTGAAHGTMPGLHLRAVESDLLTLGQEARRSLPSVKDAAERVAVDIRKYTPALHSSTATLPLDVERHGSLISQLLGPFILACNHAEAPKKVLSHALVSLQRFVTADALPATEYGNLVRVLEIQVRTSGM